MPLTYSLNAGGTSYTVASNSCTAGDVTIPSTYNGLPVTAVAAFAFQSCATITSVIIPESVTTIGNYSFGSCPSLSSATIPSSLISIGNYAFNGSGLTSINVNASNPNYSSVDGVLFNKNKTTIIAYPKNKIGSSYTIPNTVTIIGGQAFLSASLTSIIIPDSVTSIGDSAFNNCLSLTSIILPSGLSNIDSFAFGYTGLINITIPNNITTINTATFRNCYNLISVTLPTNLTSIGNFAFATCTNLNNVTIPKKVNTLGSSAFSDCYNLTKINFLGNPPTLGENAFLRANADLKVYYLRFTPGWTSTFDAKPTIAFTLSSNMIKSGGTGKITGKQRYDVDAASYFNRVQAIDGQLEDTTKTAINTFIIGCKSDGIWDAMKSCCILAGARTLNGALVPLKGTAPTNFNFVSSDYSRANGLQGNASNKYLNSNRTSDADPTNNIHRAFYITSTSANNAGFIYGNSDTCTTTDSESLRWVSSQWAITFRSASGSSEVTNSHNGFVGLSSNNNSTYIYRNNSTVRTRSIGAESPKNNNIFIYALNYRDNCITGFRTIGHSDVRISFYSLGENLDLSLLNARLITLMSALSTLT